MTDSICSAFVVPLVLHTAVDIESSCMASRESAAESDDHIFVVVFHLYIISMSFDSCQSNINITKNDGVTTRGKHLSVLSHHTVTSVHVNLMNVVHVECECESHDTMT